MPRPVALKVWSQTTSMASPEDLIEMQIYRPHPRPTELETLEIGPNSLCLIIVCFTLKFEIHWLDLNLQRLVYLVWGYRWALTSFICPRKIQPELRTDLHLQFIPKATESSEIKWLFQAIRFYTILLFSKEGMKTWFLLIPHSQYGTDDTRSQLLQPPMSPIRLLPLP